MKYEESNIQKTCVAWFKLLYPKYLIFHVPNERKQSVIAGARLKAQGQLAGVPDLVIVLNAKVMFIEVKSSKGKLTENQIFIQKKLMELNHSVHTIYSFDEFKNLITTYL